MMESAQLNARDQEVERVQTLLRNLATMTRAITDHLVHTARNDNATNAMNHHQRAPLDGRVPKHTLTHLLQLCETFALVSGPVALQSGDFATVERSARALMAELRCWREELGTANVRVPLFTRASSEQQQAALAMSPEIRAMPTETRTALSQISMLLHQLEQPVTTPPPTIIASRWRGREFALPLVMLITIAMLLFLVSSVALASNYTKPALAGTPTIIITTPTSSTTPPQVTATP